MVEDKSLPREVIFTYTLNTERGLFNEAYTMEFLCCLSVFTYAPYYMLP